MLVLAILLAPVSGTAGEKASSPARRTGKVRIEVLSNRADLISGGDAYIEILLPRGASPRGLSVWLGRNDVSGAFSVRPGGRVLGVVDGLRLGRNVVKARLRDGRGARITITNHPIGGPVFAGPQVKPWICLTEENGLGPPRDAKCNVDPVHTFHYKPAAGGPLAAYDPQNAPPPGQVATTTTDEGERVPFIVRRERGVMDRGIYDVAVLFDPEQPWQPWAPQKGWNGKVLMPGGQGCTANHEQGSPPDVLGNGPTGRAGYALSRGFAVAANAMFDNTRNCNDVVQAEAVMMLKEHLVETYGEIRYTIGEGGSGGSMFQHSVAANYPGLLDGIQPAASFPDIWSTYSEFGDCHLLMRYFNETSPHLWSNAQQRAWVSGHASVGPCVYGTARAPAYMDPQVGDGCGDYEWSYHPEDNPDGVRCNVPDYQVSLFGRRKADGFANRAWDNVGVQYGLAALEQGRILPEQFVDLNAKVGGWDIDLGWQPQRTVADPAGVRNAYRAGRLHNGRELAQVPIIDLRGSSNHEGHYDFHTRVVRERLQRDNGHHDNHVAWGSPGPLLPDARSIEESFVLIDRWLAGIEADTSDAPLEVKVLRNKPAEAVDACWFGGAKVTDPGFCETAVPDYRDARVVAGGPLTSDVVKCRRKPLDRADYTVTFTDDQWARLQAAFPNGVCDYSVPGVGQRPPAGPWLTFAQGPGGKPLGPPPQSTPLR